MRRSRILITVVSFAALSSLLAAAALAQEESQAPAYRLDDAQVRFECEGEGVDRPAKGRFGAVSSNMRLDPRRLSTLRANVEILLSSLQTGESGYDAMIRRAPFLAIEDNPISRFEVRRVEGARFVPTNRWATVRLHGRFTLHGITRDVVVPARVRCTPARDGQPEKIEVHAELHFLWADYEVTIPAIGHTRGYTGTGAKVDIVLRYARA